MVRPDIQDAVVLVRDPVLMTEMAKDLQGDRAIARDIFGIDHRQSSKEDVAMRKKGGAVARASLNSICQDQPSLGRRPATALDDILVLGDPILRHLLNRLLIDLHLQDPLVDDIGVELHLFQELPDFGVALVESLE